jgi:hypothetical protein
MADKGTSGPTHTGGTRQGEDIKQREGQEPGRKDTGASHAGRATGTKTARDSTGINPDEVESPEGNPNMPPA